MTEKVTDSWQMWRFNRILNPGGPDTLVVPESCCVTDKVGSTCTPVLYRTHVTTKFV